MLKGEYKMVVSLSRKQTYYDRLLCVIRKEYDPENVTVEELADNIIDMMMCEFEENHTNYFAIPDDPLADTISFVNFCGGFKAFDRDMG